MEARLLRNDECPAYDLMLLSIDEYSLRTLSRGDHLRVAFFTDNRDDLPWYKRNCMVSVIGKNLDLENQERVWKEKDSKEGYVDKNYLFASIKEVQERLLATVMKELNVLPQSSIQ